MSPTLTGFKFIRAYFGCSEQELRHLAQRENLAMLRQVLTNRTFTRALVASAIFSAFLYACGSDDDSGGDIVAGGAAGKGAAKNAGQSQSVLLIVVSRSFNC